MKRIVLLMTAVLMFNSASRAATPTYAERIQAAIDEIYAVSEGGDQFQLTPNEDAKVMMKELSLKVYGEDVFEERWLGDDSSAAWDVDGGGWSYETLEGGQGYVLGALEQRLEESDMSDEAKLKYVNDKLQVERAFTALRYIKGLKYGVMGEGAVQCGVSFPSLLILDTKSGKAWQIIMEGSGC